MRLRAGVGFLATVLAAAALADTRRVTSAIVVNSAADVHDANPGDGVCETAAGNGVCTLRAAIEEANALAGADTITFSPSFSGPTTFVLTAHIDITTDMTIIGRGASNTIIDGIDGHERAFFVLGSAMVTLSSLTVTRSGVLGNDVQTVLHLEDLAVTNSPTGIATNGTATLDHCVVTGNSSALDGGGIYNTGALTVTATTIGGNSAQHGGGIFSSAAGTVTLTDSTVASNGSAAYGGGIAQEGGTLTLIDTTVTANQSDGPGGGIYAATLHTYNATIAGNQAGVAQMGGGVFLNGAGADSSIANTILALNYSVSKRGNVPTDCSGNFFSFDYNLVQTLTDCTITGATTNNIYGTDPNLGPLQDNGGPTQTSALFAGSKAIDAGNPSGCTDNFGATLTTDQRGYVRPINGRCDMGAYEFGSRNPLARSFFSLAPCRVIDTRRASGPQGGPPLAAGATRDFVLVGTCGIPAGARAVSVNVTVTGPTAAGDLRVLPGGAPLPLVSTINYRAAQTRANNAVVTLGASGDIGVRCDQASGSVQFILDVNGYFQ